MTRWIVFISILGICVGATVWITNLEYVAIYPTLDYPELLNEIWAHFFQLVLPAALIAMAIAIPLGLIVTRPRFKRLASPVMGVASAAMAIPSMAVLAIMIPIFIALEIRPAFGVKPSLVALVFWGVLPILRNTCAGINNISPGVLEAARGMGMNPGQIARRIELPLALPVIMAGIRVTTVILVGTATLAAIVGAPGLGQPILRGVLMGQPLLTLQGAAPAAAMAILLSSIFGYIEHRLTPRGIKFEVGF